MPIINAQDISKSYGSRQVLDGISLTIHAGQKIGLVGANGCGKTTLVRILAGVESTDGGKVVSRRQANIGYLAQIPDLDVERSALDNAVAGLKSWNAAYQNHLAATQAIEAGSGSMQQHLEAQAKAAADLEQAGGWSVSHRAEAMLGHLGVEQVHRLVGTMSGGEQRRVALARILVAEPALAILDEPTNHLDIEAIEWLENHLSESYTGALLLISHDRYLIDGVVDRVCELDGGNLYGYEGGYRGYLQGKAEREDREQREESKRQNFLRTELEWLRRQPKARTGKQKARIDRAEASLDRAPPAKGGDLKLKLASSRVGKSILELKGLSLAIGDLSLVKDLDFTMAKGQRVGIVGPNGCGKSTLLKAIVGEFSPTAGEIVLGKNTAIRYLSQTRDMVDLNRTVEENVADGRSHVVVGDNTIQIHSYLRRFLFERATLSQQVGTLSGGERTRVALAMLLLGASNLLILDEPTNDLDVPTLTALEAMLLEFQGTALVVTHDRWFLDRVANHLLVFEEESHVATYVGNYSIYQSLKLAAEAKLLKKEKTVAKAPSKGKAAKEKKEKGLTYAEEIELDGLMDRVEQAEQEASDLEEKLGDPSQYGSYPGGMAALAEAIDQARATAQQLVDRWEHLESKRA
jgi:ABC transport system ATP-binding/permease protein